MPQFGAKAPTQATTPGDEKRPRSLGIDHDNLNKRRIVWRFADVDHEGDWGFGDVTGAQMQQLLQRLGHFETMTVGELFNPGSAVGKVYEVPELPAAALQRLTAIDRDDEVSLHALRCTGPVRVHGFLREHVFHVLWYDPEHEVWPSKKRNT